MTEGPITNGRNGRGQFQPGHKFSVGHGRPARGNLTQWRELFATVTTPERLRNVLVKLIESAEQGEPWAVKELLDRCFGKAQLPIKLETEHTENLEVRIRFDGDG